MNLSHVIAAALTASGGVTHVPLSSIGRTQDWTILKETDRLRADDWVACSAPASVDAEIWYPVRQVLGLVDCTKTVRQINAIIMRCTVARYTPPPPVNLFDSFCVSTEDSPVETLEYVMRRSVELNLPAPKRGDRSSVGLGAVNVFSRVPYDNQAEDIARAIEDVFARINGLGALVINQSKSKPDMHTQLAKLLSQ